MRRSAFSENHQRPGPGQLLPRRRTAGKFWVGLKFGESPIQRMRRDFGVCRRLFLFRRRQRQRWCRRHSLRRPNVRNARSNCRRWCWLDDRFFRRNGHWCRRCQRRRDRWGWSVRNTRRHRRWNRWREFQFFRQSSGRGQWRRRGSRRRLQYKRLLAGWTRNSLPRAFPRIFDGLAAMRTFAFYELIHF